MLNKLISLFLIVSTIVSCNTDKAIKETGSNNTPLDYYKLKNKKDLNIDSLYISTSLLKDDTIKVNQLLTIYKLSIRHRPIRIDILNKAFTLSKELEYNTGIAKCLMNKGLDYRYKHQYIKSIIHHKQALEYFEKSWDVKSRIKNLNSLGVAYRRINVEDEAIKYYFEALKLSEKEEHTKSIAIAMNGIGNAYIILKNYDYAIKYFKLSLSLEERAKSIRGTGYDYSNLGEAYMYKEQYDSSFFYHNKALEVANKLNIENDKAIIYSSIAQMYQYKGDTELALKYYLDAIPILKKQKSKRLLSFSLINVGKIYIKEGDLSKAEKYTKEGLNISKEIGTKDNTVLGFEALSNIYEIKHDFEKALNEYKNMVIYRDSIFDMKSNYNIAALEIKFDSKKKDDKIEKLSLQSKIQESRNLNLLLIIIFVSVLAVFFILYNRIRIKNQNLEIVDMRHKIEKYLTQISKLENGDNKEHSDIKHKIDIEEYGLSTRELEVLSLISKGYKNQEIADKMFVSLSTIKTHTKNIFDKLNVRNRIEAAKKAQEL